MGAAGHDVRVDAQPDLTDAIVQAGLTAVPVGNALNPAELSRRARQRPRSRTCSAAPGSTYTASLGRVATGPCKCRNAVREPRSALAAATSDRVVSRAVNDRGVCRDHD